MSINALLPCVYQSLWCDLKHRKMLDEDEPERRVWGSGLGFVANSRDPCKWLNLTKMVEISRSDFRNFSAPERFQWVEEIRREPESRGRKKRGSELEVIMRHLKYMA